MRKTILLDNVDASVQQISEAQNLEKRTDWKLFVTATGLDGTPHLYLEEIAEGGKCSPAPTTGYTLICNTIDDLDYFPITEDLTIEKKDFKANWYRVRLEANDNTTGTVTVKLAFKDYP